MYPMPLSAQHQSYKVPEGKRTWHVNSSGLDMTIKDGRQYKLVPAGSEDSEKVRQFYLRCPVNGYDIASVEIIHNLTQSACFQSRVEVLNQRSGNTAFAPKWQTELNAQWRAVVYQQYKSIAAPHTDLAYPAIKFLPMWHGTKASVVESICKTGFANLASTDSGYFGKGLYSSYEAKYAYEVYGKEGVLILNWVACFSAYPVIDGDMANLTGKANYQNYDAHFIPVVPKDPNNANETQYFPCKSGQKHRYTEIVIFEPSLCLPRYKVTLQATLTKGIAQSQFGIVPAAKAPVVQANGPKPGDVLTYIEKAKTLYAAQNYPEAFKYYLYAANVGSAEAQYMAGMCYYNAKGVSLNHTEAAKYLQLSANQNNPHALYMVGLCSYYGHGVLKDLVRAKRYFQNASNLGSLEANKALQAMNK